MVKLFAILIVLLGLLTVFFGFTDPDNLPIGLLLVPILMFFAIFSLTTYILTSIFMSRMSKYKKRNLSILIGVLSVMFLLFYSSGGIVAGDVILITLIFLIGLLYIQRY
jgi:uncharacterized membrane protein